MLLRVASRMFGVGINSYHVADTAFVALAGCLHLRSV